MNMEQTGTTPKISIFKEGGLMSHTSCFLNSRSIQEVQKAERLEHCGINLEQHQKIFFEKWELTRKQFFSEIF